MELKKDVPSNMHYCLYCIARGRKKSDSLIFFFFFSSRKLELLSVLHCVLSENLWFVVFTFQKKEKKRDTARFRSFFFFFFEKMLDLD